MVRCVSGDCHQEIAPGWSFCPYCGADNREPEHRPPVTNCNHEFLASRRFCVHCGKAFKPAKNSKWTWAWVQRDQAYIDDTEVEVSPGWGLRGGWSGLYLSNPRWEPWLELIGVVVVIGSIVAMILERWGKH